MGVISPEYQREVNLDVLNERISFAPPSLRVLVKINEVELPKGLEHLLYVRFAQVEVERTDIELHASWRRVHARRQVESECLRLAARR